MSAECHEIFAVYTTQRRKNGQPVWEGEDVLVSVSVIADGFIII